MKSEYDFSNGKRGRVAPESPLESGKIQVTIRLDEEIVHHFGTLADNSGGAVGYECLINAALREYIEGKTPGLEDILRRIIREELDRRPAA